MTPPYVCVRRGGPRDSSAGCARCGALSSEWPSSFALAAQVERPIRPSFGAARLSIFGLTLMGQPLLKPKQRVSIGDFPAPFVNQRAFYHSSLLIRALALGKAGLLHPANRNARAYSALSCASAAVQPACHAACSSSDSSLGTRTPVLARP